MVCRNEYTSIIIDLPHSTTRVIHLQGTALIILDGDGILLTTAPWKAKKSGANHPCGGIKHGWLGNPLQILVQSQKKNHLKWENHLHMMEANSPVNGGFIVGNSGKIMGKSCVNDGSSIAIFDLPGSCRHGGSPSHRPWFFKYVFNGMFHELNHLFWGFPISGNPYIWICLVEICHKYINLFFTFQWH